MSRSASLLDGPLPLDELQAVEPAIRPAILRAWPRLREFRDDLRRGSVGFIVDDATGTLTSAVSAVGAREAARHAGVPREMADLITAPPPGRLRLVVLGPRSLAVVDLPWSEATP